VPLINLFSKSLTLSENTFGTKYREAGKRIISLGITKESEFTHGEIAIDTKKPTRHMNE
jgi:hypothetical protein